MPKAKKIVKVAEVNTETITVNPVVDVVIPRITPLAQEFGNGDMNVLRDKINEIVKHLS